MIQTVIGINSSMMGLAGKQKKSDEGLQKGTAGDHFPD